MPLYYNFGKKQDILFIYFVFSEYSNTHDKYKLHKAAEEHKQQNTRKAQNYVNTKKDNTQC